MIGVRCVGSISVGTVIVPAPGRVSELFSIRLIEASLKSSIMREFYYSEADNFYMGDI